MNLIESIVHNLSRNKFENSGQYKILIMQTIHQHKDYHKFGDEVTSELNKLKITSYRVIPPLRHHHDDYKCIIYLGTEDWKYDLRFKASNLEGLQAESIMIHYLRLGEVPII